MTSRVYCYGLLAPSREHEALIVEQLRGANRYRNRLIEIEHWRHEEYAKIVLSPETDAIQAQIDTLATEIEALIATIKPLTRKDRKAAQSRSSHFGARQESLERVRMAATPLWSKTTTVLRIRCDLCFE